jgi:hypothetical protein
VGWAWEHDFRCAERRSQLWETVIWARGSSEAEQATLAKSGERRNRDGEPRFLEELVSLLEMHFWYLF